MRENDGSTLGVPGADGGSVRFIRRLPARIDRVWAFVADTRLRAQWFYGGELEPAVGGRVAVAEDIGGVVTAWEPPKLFAFTWNHPGWDSDSSDVRIELAPDGEATVLTLTHSRMVGDDRVANATGWHAHLESLVSLVQHAPGRERAAIEQAVQPRYEQLFA